MANNLQLPKLSKVEFETNAKPQLIEVFNFPCEFIAPFTNKMKERRIIYSEIHPSLELLNAIIKVAAKNGENGFYFSFVELSGNEIHYPGMSRDFTSINTWFIPFFNLQDYLNQFFVPGHVIYSVKGNWGLYQNDDDFLLIGGIPKVISSIFQILPKKSLQLDDFFADWKNKHEFLKADLSWIPKLLEHIYGEKKTKRLLEEYDFWD